MYPTLETERLLLESLQDNDLDDMYALYANPAVAATMEHWDSIQDYERYQKEFPQMVAGDDYFTIRLKDTGRFIGCILLHQYVKRNKIDYSQMLAAILPEYWGCGYCTEATKKLLHFAFIGVKTPWVCANQFQDNPAAGKVLQRCGLRFHAALKNQNRLYDQYRYTKADYLKSNQIAAEETNPYDYVFPIKRSPYSYGNPIRKIDAIEYIEQPTEYTCGQSVVAMLAGVSVEEAVSVSQTEYGMDIPEMRDALAWYGFKTATRERKKYRRLLGGKLPDCCVLSVRLPEYGHWSLYYKGKFYDPEFGVLDKLPEQAKLVSYWEVI